jgi:hypothetical protein
VANQPRMDEAINEELVARIPKVTVKLAFHTPVSKYSNALTIVINPLPSVIIAALRQVNQRAIESICRAIFISFSFS